MNIRINKPFRVLVFMAMAFLLSAAPLLRAQTWVTDASLKVARWNHSATLLTNGLVLVAGGLVFNDNTHGFIQSTNEAELYNPATGSSTVIAPMSVAHLGGCAVLLTNGSVLMAGGRNNGGSVVNTAELYVPSSGTWVPTGSLPQERGSFTTVLLTNGQVLAIGGGNNGAVDQASCEIYNVPTAVWTNTAPLPWATDSGAAVVLPNGKVLFCGGSDGVGGVRTNSAVYNPLTATWTNTSPLNVARGGHTAILLTNGNVLVVGGAFNETTEIFSPATGKWTNAAPMIDSRSYPQAVLLPNGKVLVLGGDPGQKDAELYDSASNTWTPASSLHIGRFYSTATSLGDGEVVVTGGNAGTIGYYNGPAMADVETYAGHPVTLDHTLVAHYPFDADPNSDGPFSSQFLQDTSGNGYDIAFPSSGDGNYPIPTATNIAGGSGVQFDGNNWYELPTNLLTTIAGTYSLSLWLKTTDVSDDGNDDADGFDSPAFVWAGGVGADYLDSEPMTLTGHKAGFFTGGDGSTLHSASDIDTGNFTHIVITREQPTGVKKIYINGVLDAFETAGTNVLSDSTDLVLGESFYHNGVTGVVDDVQFYSGLLSSGEVSFLYNNPGSTAPAGLLATLDFALNDTNLSWTTSGDDLWSGESDVTHDGAAAAQSGSLQSGQSSTLQTTVAGPGTVTFWWKLVNGGDQTSLEFDIDGNFQDSLNDDTDWTQRSFHVDAGTHNLGWTVFAGDDVTPNDAGYVDQVVFTPDIVPPSPGMWRFTGSLTNAPTQHTATLLTNGLVLVCGGEDNSDIPFASAQLYNPTTGTWTGTHSLNQARFAHTATLLTNGMVLVVGGSTNAFTLAAATATAELYNPVTGNWTFTGSLHTGRYIHTATLLPDGKVLVAGGESTNAFPDITSTAEVYDPSTGVWTATNSMTHPRYGYTATLLQNGQVLVAGGSGTNATIALGSSELYNPATGTWSDTGLMPFPLANQSAALLPNGKVLIAAGDIDENFGFGFELLPSNLAALYDPNTGTWAATGNMVGNHDFDTATLLTNGLVLVAGVAFGSSGTATNSSELYSPSSGTWSLAGGMKAPRHNHTATLLPNGLVLAVAGQSPNNTSSAELYSTFFIPTITITNATKSAGIFQFGFTNTAGAGSTIFATTNITIPFSNWTALGSPTEVSPGVFKFIDSSATNSRRFYRVQSP